MYIRKMSAKSSSQSGVIELLAVDVARGREEASLQDGWVEQLANNRVHVCHELAFDLGDQPNT